jgi:ferric-dicitrate binding protein FerR (iron transport regulator)
MPQPIGQNGRKLPFPGQPFAPQKNSVKNSGFRWEKVYPQSTIHKTQVMNITPELLSRYRQGLCTQAEMHVVEAWAQQNEAVDNSDFPHPGREAELETEMWSVIHNYRQKPPVRTLYSRRRLTGWITAAATVAVVAGVLLFLYGGRKNAGNVLAAKVADSVTIHTARGERRTVQLPDGSQLVLNSASQLAYVPAEFAGNARNIYLSGEGFITVAADAKRPFTVISPLTKVQVLGTSFNVQAYAEDTAAWVTVEEGKVALTLLPANSSVTLSAGEQGIAGYSLGAAPYRRNVYAGSYAAWRHNQLVVQDKSLAETAQVLQRWFNKKVVIDNAALRQERFTGGFSNPQPEQVLKAIAFVIKCRYSITDKEIRLY